MLHYCLQCYVTFSCKTFKITSTAVTVTSSSCKSNHKTQFSVIQTLPVVFKNARKTTYLFRASFCQHLNRALQSVIMYHLIILLHEVGYNSAPPSGRSIQTNWTLQLTAVGITFTWQSSGDWHWKTDTLLTCSRPLLPARAVVPSQGTPRALGWGTAAWQSAQFPPASVVQPAGALGSYTEACAPNAATVHYERLHFKFWIRSPLNHNVCYKCVSSQSRMRKFHKGEVWEKEGKGREKATGFGFLLRSRWPDFLLSILGGRQLFNMMTFLKCTI